MQQNQKSVFQIAFRALINVKKCKNIEVKAQYDKFSITFDTKYMKFKLKINETTTLDDIRNELETLKSANVNEIPLNHLLKIIEFLGAIQVPSTGSIVRFEHHILKKHPYYRGYFSIHKTHKGGDMDLIKRIDFKAYLYPALLAIIELTAKK
jgi:hypothetical protein